MKLLQISHLSGDLAAMQWCWDHGLDPNQVSTTHRVEVLEDGSYRFTMYVLLRGLKVLEVSQRSAQTFTKTVTPTRPFPGAIEVGV